MDNVQLIILIVTVIGSMLAHGKVILGHLSALESRMSALEDCMSHMEGLFEGFRATGFSPSPQAVKKTTGMARL